MDPLRPPRSSPAGPVRARGDHRAIRAAVTVLLVTSFAAPVGAQRSLGAPRDTLANLDTSTTSAPSRSLQVTRGDSGARYRPESFTHFAMRTFGPLPLLRSTAMAGLDQWRRAPVGWSQTGRGFRDRLDSHLSAEVLSHTIRFGVASAAREEIGKYQRCECVGFGARLEHALVTPLRVETPRGEHLSAVTPFGEIASALVVTSVQPGGFSIGRGLHAGASGLASASLTAVAREFWPWHWRPPGL